MIQLNGAWCARWALVAFVTLCTYRLAANDREFLPGDPVRVAVRLSGGPDHVFALSTNYHISQVETRVSKSLPTFDAPRAAVRTSLSFDRLVRIENLAVEGTTMESQFLLLSRDISHLRTGFGVPVDGLLCMDALRSLVVRINFESGKCVVTRRVGKEDIDGYKEVDIALRGALPFVPVFFDGHAPVLALLSLSTTECSVALPPKFRETLHRSGVYASDAMVASEESRRAVLDAEVGRIVRMSLGGFDSSNICAWSSGQFEHVVIGLNFLARFHVVLDFPNSKLDLKPNRWFHRPDVTHLWGMEFKNGKPLVVVGGFACQNALASESGVRIGDGIVAVNGKDMRHANSSEVIRRLLFPMGDSMDITIQREEEQFTLRLPSNCSMISRN